MQGEFQCPHCRSAIPADDVNVASDLALCRNCGKTSPFSAVAGAAKVSLEALARPPRWLRTQRNTRGGRRIVYRRPSPILLFLVPFAVVWSGGSLIGIYGRQFQKGEFDLAQSLFGLPFLIGSIVMFGAILYLAFGRWEVTLDRGQGTVFVGLGRLGWTRRFSYGRDTRVSIRKTSVTVNDVPQQGICVQTGDQELLFGALLREEAKQYIAASIMQTVAEAE